MHAASTFPEETDVDGVVLGPVLGKGGMGIVYEAVELDLDRTIAVKYLRQDRTSEVHASALLAEARITSAVAHPSVIPIHDVRLAADGRPCILLERIEGRPWSRLLRDPGAVLRDFGEANALALHVQVLAKVCGAVHAAHVQGIVHRDLKPGNVMITPEGDVYLLDWGLAVSLDPTADARLPRLEDSPQGAGTPQYMAPEMVSDRHGEIGPWTDVYLLGGLLYHLLWGHPPHQGDTPWAMVLEACRTGVSVPDDGPAELVALCRGCLARDPADRIQDAESVRRGLIAWLQHRPSADLAEEGRSQQALLEALLEAPSEELPAQRVQELFGATVFAYHRALDSWPENPAALEGLTGTVRAVVHHALRSGELSLAQAALGYLRTPPDDLLQAVEQARCRTARAAQQRAQWRSLGIGDLNVGALRPARLLLLAAGTMVLLSSAATAIGLTALGGLTASGLFAASVAGLAVAGTAIAGVLLTRVSPLDRRIAGHLLFFAVARVLVLAGAASAGASGAEAASVELGIGLVLLVHQSLAFRRRLWPAAIAMALLSAFCLVFGPASALCLASGHALMGVALIRANRRTA